MAASRSFRVGSSTRRFAALLRSGRAGAGAGFLVLACLLAAGCGAGFKRLKPQPGPAPALPEGAAEATDRAQKTVVLALAKALSADSMEQMGLIHPILLPGWKGYGPYATCDAPAIHKLPVPDPRQVALYYQTQGWGDDPEKFGKVRAWAILDRPCRPDSAWGRAGVWLVEVPGEGWRVIRYETDGAWYTG